MTGEIQITLKELTQIALGSPEINEVNVAVLHSLFDILLKKMNCESEIISFEGMEGTCLQKLLEKSKISSFYFNTDGIESLSDKMQRLDDLEKRTILVEKKLHKHFERARRCLASDKMLSLLPKYHPYSHLCEDLLLVDADLHQIELIKNRHFVMKLMHILSVPFVRHMQELENQIEKSRKEFMMFVSRAREKYKRIIVAEGCILNLESLKTNFENLELKFNNTMDELQMMLDAKLCKEHLPPLRKYIKDKLNELEESLDLLKFSHFCKDTKPVDPKSQCLSCGFCHVCDSNLPFKRHRDRMECEVPPELISICSRKPQLSCGEEPIENEIPLQTRINNLNYNNIRDSLGLTTMPSGRRRSTRLPSLPFI